MINVKLSMVLNFTFNVLNFDLGKTRQTELKFDP